MQLYMIKLILMTKFSLAVNITYRGIVTTQRGMFIVSVVFVLKILSNKHFITTFS